MTNGYGPTENTVCATLFTMNSESWRPLSPGSHRHAHQRAWRCCFWTKPAGRCPTGCPESFCLAGVSLARGYLGRPRGLGQGFRSSLLPPRPAHVPPPATYAAAGQPTVCWSFCTATMGRSRCAGNRLELGEVEAALLECPQVVMAVAAAGDWLGDGDTSLGGLRGDPGRVGRWQPARAAERPAARLYGAGLFRAHRVGAHYVDRQGGPQRPAGAGAGVGGPGAGPRAQFAGG